MLTCRLYLDGVLADDGFDPARISDHLEEDGTLLWVDVLAPDAGDLAMLRDEFSVHPWRSRTPSGVGNAPWKGSAARTRR